MFWGGPTSIRGRLQDTKTHASQGDALVDALLCSEAGATFAALRGRREHIFSGSKPVSISGYQPLGRK